jgi:hypothetical protein
MVSLSQEFAPICLSFKVCKFDTVPDFNFDKFVKEYHQDEITKLTFVPNTINMYFVASVKIGSSVVGGYGGPGGPVLIKKSALSVIPHEVGHYLTLMHTFDMPGELADGSNGDNPAIGDGLRDTEADPNTAGVSISDCGYPGATLKDANGDFYLSPVDNIMSYYSGCQCPGKGFTPQQLNQVAKYLLGLPSDPW